MGTVLPRYSWLLLTVLVALVPLSREQDEDIPHNEVKNWALKFGVDLWEFGRQFTKMDEIKSRYQSFGADVARKDGLLLIREMASEVKNMMDIKMNAVMRIMDSAEQAALSHKFDAATSVRYFNARRLNNYGPDGRTSDGSRDMTLMHNRHFDQLFVNTSLSSVLMPGSVEEEDPEVLNAIKWSEYLDALFVNNYEMDPSLSWQYFGSSSGFLRRYPAVRWPPDETRKSGQDMFDFRSCSWFIDAATSPKDILVLVDNSGSMTGQRRDIAKAVISAILDTLGNNDFVNVLRFSDTTDELVPCFRDMLVQANSDNVRELRNALDNLRAENIANFTSALVTAFEILNRYNRTSQGCQCNQAIMLITDGPPDSYQHIFKQYNWPHMPVRVFTYLVGKDATNAANMNWMACSNKGFYTRIASLADVRPRVLNYITVMARPMIMYQNDHPIQWTPVYSGGKGDSIQVDHIQDSQLMTSVSTPIFDRRNYSTRSSNTDERVANLLGVVGTDVPIEQIKKLVQPYKLGVNGYSFIVNNNGHVLYHPDLRPLINNGFGQYQDTLKPTYNSVDLTEVELVDGDGGPRENNTLLLDLRHDMIDQKEGEMELSVKVHYDDMKRVTTRRHRYFYNPIDGTPFSLGLAIPEGYGMYEVLGEKEIKHSTQNVSNYFKGSNWKVHPSWVYCEYNYATEHRFRTPEEQMLHFLTKTSKPGWKWMSLRPRSPLKDAGSSNMKKLEKDSYFCDKSLMQSLVFDASVTESLGKNTTVKDGQKSGYQMFGVTTSFIATRSGLLRWQDHSAVSVPSDQAPPHFSEGNRRATDESWYKRAIDQYNIEPDSFVFSVPFDASTSVRPLVTATHAVFLERQGHRAPAAVVGLQFLHSTLASHFLNITSVCSGCKKTCASEELDCYVLDDNGFIILSETADHTGKFFGQIDGTIMDSLVQDRIYKKVAVYDYQGGCFEQRNPHSDVGARMGTPLQPMKWLLQWVLGQFLWIAVQTNLYQLWDPNMALAAPPADEDPGDSTDYESEPKNYDSYGPSTKEEPPWGTPEDRQPVPPEPPQLYPAYVSPAGTTSATFNKTQPRPCDKKVDLYSLQADRLNTSGMFNPLKGKLTNCHVTGCERPFSVQKIPRSNLILLVVDTLCPCGSKQLSITPHEVSYETATQSCRSRPQEAMYRRRPAKCMNYHPEESEIKVCGGGGTASIIHWLPLLSLAVWVISSAPSS